MYVQAGYGRRVQGDKMTMIGTDCGPDEVTVGGWTEEAVLYLS